MKIYLIVIEDRHRDVVIQPRRDKEFAIDEARGIAAFRAQQHGFELDENNEYFNGLYWGCYSCEGDCVYVIEEYLK